MFSLSGIFSFSAFAIKLLADSGAGLVDFCFSG
jgi:hypothetical protein